MRPIHDDPVRGDQPDDGQLGDRSGPMGVIHLETTFWALGFLWLMSRVRVELDGERRELPWGQLRLPVAAGTHRLRVSCKYLWMDAGAATREVDVHDGQMVVLRYRAPVLVFLAGKLRLLGEEPARPDGLQSPATFRPISSGRKAWVLGLTAVSVVIAFIVGFSITSSLAPGPGDSTGWVSVTEVDGVRFDMPRLPRHATSDVPGTDVTFDTYSVTFDDIEMAAVVSRIERPPGDTRSDAQVLEDYASGMATNISGTIVDSRPVDVDGERGRDVEVTTPQAGGVVVLARVALVDDLLVGVQTAFDPNDRDAATAAHDRMARSLDFD